MTYQPVKGCVVLPTMGERGVPLCNDRCPSYDGKRCDVLGCRPDRICEPAVAQLAEAAGGAPDVTTLRDVLRKARRCHDELAYLNCDACDAMGAVLRELEP